MATSLPNGNSDLTQEIMRNICEPLFETFGVTYFGYGWSDWRGRYFTLSTDNEWGKFSELVPTEIILDGLPDLCFKSIIELSDCREDSPFQREFLTPLEEKFGYYHNVILQVSHLGYTDWYHFGTTKNNQQFPRLFRAYIQYFKKFTRYFKHEANDLIIKAKKTRTKRFPSASFVKLECGKIPEPLSNAKLEKFNEELIPCRFYLHNENLPYLTRREYQCLCWLLKGYNYKHIARFLKIGQRTVQDYMNKIRSKLNLKNKKDLISYVENNFAQDIMAICKDPHSDKNDLFQAFFDDVQSSDLSNFSGLNPEKANTLIIPEIDNEIDDETREILL